MNTCSLEKYIEEFSNQIYQFCQPNLCEFCGNLLESRFRLFVDPSTNYNYHFHCYLENLPKSIKNIYTREEIIEKWCNVVFVEMGKIKKTILSKIIQKAYKNLPIDKIGDFVKTSISFYGITQLGAYQKNTDWIIALVNVYKFNPNITSDDIIRELRDMFYLDYISTKQFKKEIKKINDNKISKLWDLWELETPEYTNYIQFLPEEMIVDVSEIEGKPGERFSYSLY